MKCLKLLRESITPSLPNAHNSSQAQISIGADKLVSSFRVFRSISVLEFSKISSSSKLRFFPSTSLNIVEYKNISHRIYVSVALVILHEKDSSVIWAISLIIRGRKSIFKRPNE